MKSHAGLSGIRFAWRPATQHHQSGVWLAHSKSESIPERSWNYTERNLNVSLFSRCREITTAHLTPHNIGAVCSVDWYQFRILKHEMDGNGIKRKHSSRCNDALLRSQMLTSRQLWRHAKGKCGSGIADNDENRDIVDWWQKVKGGFSLSVIIMWDISGDRFPLASISSHRWFNIIRIIERYKCVTRSHASYKFMMLMRWSAWFRLLSTSAAHRF